MRPAGSGVRSLLQRDDRIVQELRDDPARERLDRGALVGREIVQPARVALELALQDRVAAASERADQGCQLVAAATDDEPADLFGDDLTSRRDRVLLDRRAAIARAREIVSEEVRRFVVRRRGDELAPLIRALRRRGDAVLQGELERQARRLHDLTPDERAAVEALARGIVAKLLHDPIVALKERSEPGSGRTHAKLLAELLGLDPSLLDGE